MRKALAINGGKEAEDWANEMEGSVAEIKEACFNGELGISTPVLIS